MSETERSLGLWREREQIISVYVIAKLNKDNAEDVQYVVFFLFVRIPSPKSQMTEFTLHLILCLKATQKTDFVVQQADNNIKSILAFFFFLVQCLLTLFSLLVIALVFSIFWLKTAACCA